MTIFSALLRSSVSITTDFRSASVSSSRHIKALSDEVLEKLKDNGIKKSKIE